jgi:hypothetical protein
MKKLVGLCLLLSAHFIAFSQVDTSYIYNTTMPYGTLDIRLAKSATQYYYLEEDKTISFRESTPGVRTNTYRDMTAWDSSPYSEGNMRERRGTSDAFIMNYRILFPGNYNANYSPGYPLIVMIHGGGERGNCWNSDCHHASASWNPSSNNPVAPTDSTSKLMNNDHNLLHGGSPLLVARNAAGGKLPNDPTLSARAFPGFVLFPQNLNGWSGGTVQDAIRLIRLVAKKYNIDEDKIYIHGLSNGGYGVYETLKRAPWLFAAALPMSAVSDAGITTKNITSSIAHIPLWIFQGGKDTNPTPAKTASYVKKFREAGAVVKHTVYPHLGHGTWNTAYNEPDFFKWILSQNKSNLHKFAGSATICLTNGLGARLELAAGFRAYQWQRNGMLISGATGPTYTATTPGTYRARFSRVANPSEGDWNQWSGNVTVTEQQPVQAQIEQLGTVLAKDLNNYGDIKLKANGEFDHYYWYKDGVKLALSDTVSSPTFKPGSCTTVTCAGTGVYTLVTANYDLCPSPASEPKHLYFNNLAPVNITAPGNFAGTVTSPSSVWLTWTDASANETGFEIWRRKRISGTTYSKWEMRALTNANATSMNDNKGLEPSTMYHYKIRAVSNSGRSNYTPSASNEFLVVTTTNDTSAPSVPQNLIATATGINTVTLTWQPSWDNSGIRRYRINFGTQSIATESAETSYVISSLSLNTLYTFTVSAEDLGGNMSNASNSATANTYVSGLYYEHSTGAWTDLDNINWTNPEFTGKVSTFTLAPKTQDDYYNFKFDGYLYINTGGVYQFQAISSDGSRIEIDNVVVVNNDGIHGVRTITNTNHPLTAGPKRITITYFEYDEADVLTIRYRGPDTNDTWQTIPPSALKSGNIPAMADSREVVEDELPLVQASVFPNPTQQHDINIQVDNIKDTPVIIKLIDFTGRQIYQRTFEASRVNEGVKIEHDEEMPDGFYLMKIYFNNKEIQKKIAIKN